MLYLYLFYGSFEQVLGTPTREEIRCMNPNYTDFRFPQIKAHPWHKVPLQHVLCVVSLPSCSLHTQKKSIFIWITNCFGIRFFISGCLQRQLIQLHGYFSTHQVFAAQQYVNLYLYYKILVLYLILNLTKLYDIQFLNYLLIFFILCSWRHVPILSLMSFESPMPGSQMVAHFLLFLILSRRYAFQCLAFIFVFCILSFIMGLSLVVYFFSHVCQLVSWTEGVGWWV